jgi:hypothetical protein
LTTITYNCSDQQFEIVIPDHHLAHQYANGVMGNDPISIHPRMLSLLRTTVKEENSVLLKVSPFHYVYNGEFKVFNGDDLNVTPYLPLTVNSAKLILVGLDTENNVLDVVEGDEVLDSAITPPPLPASVPNAFVPSALIKLRYNITSLYDNDITDARTYISGDLLGGSGGGGASELNDLTDVTIDGTPAADELLAADGADGWNNKTAAEVDIITAKTNGITATGISNAVPGDSDLFLFQQAGGDVKYCFGDRLKDAHETDHDDRYYTETEVDNLLGAKADDPHASDHIDGGGDELDGDKLEISRTATNYTPATDAPYSTATGQLTSHLKGIDAALGGSRGEGYFLVHRNGSNQSISNNTLTKIQFNTEAYDLDGVYDNATNYRHTPDEEGYYTYYCQVRIEQQDNNAYRLYIRKNGSTISLVETDGGGSSSDDLTTTALVTVYMNGSTDYIEFYFWHNGGYTHTLKGTTNQSYATGWRIR